MKRNSGRTIVYTAIMVVLCAIVNITGCGNKDMNEEEPVKSYFAEDIDLGVEENDETSVDSLRFYNGYVYYERCDYPELPQEYYDILDRLKKSGATDISGIPGASEDEQPEADEQKTEEKKR